MRGESELRMGWVGVRLQEGRWVRVEDGLCRVGYQVPWGTGEGKGYGRACVIVSLHRFGELLCCIFRHLPYLIHVAIFSRQDGGICPFFPYGKGEI